MSELGSSAAVGIESVEWLDAGGGQLTVRVTGRWRRRRGWVESRGPTMLVVESEGRRHRFPATPEPPSLAGAAPGTWRLTFAIPAEFAHGLGGQVWLSLGTVTVPLPVPSSAAPTPTPTPVPTPAEAPVPTPADAPVPTPTETPTPAEASAGPAPAELPALIAGTEGERLRAEAALRAARLRADVRVPAEPPAPPPGDTTARAQVVDSGERPPSPSGSAAADPSGTDDAAVQALRRELLARVASEAGLRARTVQAETRLAARVLLTQRTAETLGELRGELARLRAALEHERERRRAAEAQVAQLGDELSEQRARSREAYAAIEELRDALGMRRPAEPPAPARAATPPPAGHPATAGGGASAAPGSAVTPDRLSDALARLRERAEPRDSAPDDATLGGVPPAPAIGPTHPPAPAGSVGGSVPGSGPTVEQPYRSLVARDPAGAGRLLIGLLGAQQAAWPHAIAYDLVLGPGQGCVRVTVGHGASSVTLEAAARAREQVDFQLVGDPSRIARLLLAGPLRRLLRLGVARVRGRRDGLAAVRALLGLPLDLATLRRAGVAPDPEVLFTLVAASVDPAWTRGESFTVSHSDERDRTVFLTVRDGRPPVVSTDPPAGRVATALRGSGDALWRTLGDAEPDADGAPSQTALTGDLGPLALLRTWIDRAQGGRSR